MGAQCCAPGSTVGVKAIGVNHLRREPKYEAPKFLHLVYSGTARIKPVKGYPERANPRYVRLIFTEVPNDNVRSVPLSIHVLENIAKLALQSTVTQLTNDV
jgi:hypothetical protein